MEVTKLTSYQVGYQFAILAAKKFLVTLLEKYQVDVRDQDHEMKVNTLIETTKPVAVRVSCRS